MAGKPVMSLWPVEQFHYCHYTTHFAILVGPVVFKGSGQRWGVISRLSSLGSKYPREKDDKSVIAAGRR